MRSRGERSSVLAVVRLATSLRAASRLFRPLTRCTHPWAFPPAIRFPCKRRRETPSLLCTDTVWNRSLLLELIFARNGSLCVDLPMDDVQFLISYICTMWCFFYFLFFPMYFEYDFIINIYIGDNLHLFLPFTAWRTCIARYILWPECLVPSVRYIRRCCI